MNKTRTILIGLLLLGCTPRLPQGVDQRLVEDLRGRSPEEQFEQFLSHSVITRYPAPADSPGELWQTFTAAWEDPDGQINNAEILERVRWLADYQVLSVALSPTGDSPGSDQAKATAVITTVAEESGALECRPADPAVAKESDELACDFLGQATLQVREDTAHWVMRRGLPSNGIWQVVGGSYEQFGLRRSATTLRWYPHGASEAHAMAMADSIRQARGKPVLR